LRSDDRQCPTAQGTRENVAVVHALAATGVLDDLRATAHWLAAADLARRHPAIELDANVLYVDNGRVLTSAGAAAGFRTSVVPARLLQSWWLVGERVAERHRCRPPRRPDPRILDRPTDAAPFVGL